MQYRYLRRVISGDIQNYLSFYVYIKHIVVCGSIKGKTYFPCLQLMKVIGALNISTYMIISVNLGHRQKMPFNTILKIYKSLLIRNNNYK